MTSIVEQLTKSKITLIDILQSFNYDVEQHKTISKELINQQYLNKQLNMTIKHNEENKKVVIKYLFNSSSENTKFSVKIIQEQLETAILDPFEPFGKQDTLIIIASDETVPNHNSDNICKTLNTIYNERGYFIILFNIKYLQKNILKHKYQSEFEIIKDEDKETILAELNTQEQQLPEQSRYDITSKFLLLRPNQILKTKTPSLTSGFVTKYYICLS